MERVYLSISEMKSLYYVYLVNCQDVSAKRDNVVIWGVTWKYPGTRRWVQLEIAEELLFVIELCELYKKEEWVGETHKPIGYTTLYQHRIIFDISSWGNAVSHWIYVYSTSWAESSLIQCCFSVEYLLGTFHAFVKVLTCSAA